MTVMYAVMNGIHERIHEEILDVCEVSDGFDDFNVSNINDVSDAPETVLMPKKCPLSAKQCVMAKLPSSCNIKRCGKHLKGKAQNNATQ